MTQLTLIMAFKQTNYVEKFLNVLNKFPILVDFGPPDQISISFFYFSQSLFPKLPTPSTIYTFYAKY